MNIVLIEPDRVLAQTFCEYLQNNECKVTVCLDAQSAVQALEHEIPDCIVLELQIAGHNGIEFLYELRSYPEWAHIPVVIQTLVSPARIPLVRLQKLGVSAVLYKPTTTLKTLLNTIQAAVPAQTQSIVTT